VAVHTFQQKVTDYIKEVMPVVTRIYYFSDGAASQHKNYKNFCNLLMHFEDFSVLNGTSVEKFYTMVLVGQ